MKIIHIRNTGLKAGMNLKIDGRVKAVRRLAYATFDTAIVEFTDGERTALNLRTSSPILIDG